VSPADAAVRVARWRAAVPAACVRDDLDTRTLFSQDFSGRGALVDAVFVPRAVADLQEAVRAAGTHGVALLPRGGGMSYTRGYLSDGGPAIVADLRGLAAIESLDVEHRVVVVQAGCTWAALRDALLAHGLRTPFWGPLSGLRATVGGAASQNAAFWGSGRAGSAARAVLGLEVVTGTGELWATGALATPAGEGAAERGIDGLRHPRPFLRELGPDFTGLLTGDCGAFGIKTRVALALEPLPRAEVALSFAFDTADAMLAAMGALARDGLVAQQVGFDPVLASLRTRRQSLAEDFRTLTSVLRSAKSLTRGLKDATGIVAAGRGFLEQAAFLLHVMCEGRSERAAQDDADAVLEVIAEHGGREVENTIPKVMMSAPFPALNGVVGPAGERWLPVHGLLPLANAAAAYAAVHALFGERAETLALHGISSGTLFSTVGSNAVLMEPMFFWPDALDALHREAMEPRAYERVPPRPEAPRARAAVADLRRAVIDTLAPFDAAHLQLGRTYPFLERRDETTVRAIEAVRATVDPGRILNPGVLGLAARRVDP
jgi:FAD/FMN-containing dehydrogenase